MIVPYVSHTNTTTRSGWGTSNRTSTFLSITFLRQEFHNPWESTRKTCHSTCKCHVTFHLMLKGSQKIDFIECPVHRQFTKDDSLKYPHNIQPHHRGDGPQFCTIDPTQSKVYKYIHFWHLHQEHLPQRIVIQWWSLNFEVILIVKYPAMRNHLFILLIIVKNFWISHTKLSPTQLQVWNLLSRPTAICEGIISMRKGENLPYLECISPA